MAWASTADGAAAAQAAVAAHATAVAAAAAAVAAGPPEAEAVRPRRDLTGLAGEARARVEALAAAEKAQEQAFLAAAEAAALELKVSALASAPPQSVDEWEAQMWSYAEPSIRYYGKRLKDADDYGPQMELFEAASVFEPNYLADMTLLEARRRLVKLRAHPHFDEHFIAELVGELNAVKAAADLFAPDNCSLKNGSIVHARRDPLYQMLTKGKVQSHNASENMYDIEFTVARYGASDTVIRQTVHSKHIMAEPFSVLTYFKER
jgi:hypothetical protein